MEHLVHQLNFASTVIGFLSAIILSADTIGVAVMQTFITALQRAKDDAATVDPRNGLPPVVFVTGLLLAAAIGLYIYYLPHEPFSFRLGLLYIASYSLLTWVVAFLVIALFSLVILGLRAIFHLSTLKYAGGVGFVLLAGAFLLQLTAAGMEAFGTALPGLK